MKEKTIKNVVTYYRVSTAEQTEGFSIDNQKTEVLNYCKAMKYNVIGEFVDAGITGTSISKRTGFKNLLKEISEKNIDAVIIWKLSRISRKTLDLFQILDYFEKYDVSLISHMDNINTSTSMGKMFVKLAGIFAEMERDNIIEQSKGGMRERARSGLWNGGTPPIGYETKEGVLTIIPEEAKTVSLIFDLYTNKGWGYSKICQHLNRNLDEHPTKKGNTWAYSTIKQVLDNPTYAGKIRWGVREDWNKKRRKGITEDFILADGQHQAVISDELWQRTQIKRKEVGKTPEKLKNMHYLLSGLAKCPECGSAMVSHRTYRKKKSGEQVYYRYYSCSKWNTHKGEVCHPNSVKADILEEQVIKEIKTFVNNPNIISEINKRIGKANDTNRIEMQIKNLEKEIQKLKSSETKYYQLLTDEGKMKILSEEKVLEMIKANKEKMEIVLNEETEYRNKLQVIKEHKLNYEKISLILQSFEKLFELADYEKKKELIHNLIKEIKIVNHKNIWERKASEIVLRFTGEDINSYIDTEDNGKKYDLIYDTAPSY